MQLDRYRAQGLTCNAELAARDIETAARLTAGARRSIETNHEKLAMTARSVHRTIRVSRTIADLTGSDVVTQAHMDEALLLRLDDPKR